MNAPDPFASLLEWPLPAPMTPAELEAAADEYQREAIETARSEQQEKQWNASQQRS
jgi:hypothetical protein